MPDNLKDQDSRDRNRVSSSQHWEISYMTEKFGVTANEVKQAIDAVGNSREKVEAYLQKKSKKDDR